MSHKDRQSQRNNEPKSANLYTRMMLEILNTARDWKTERVQPEDLWDAAFRDGFYEKLSEDPTLAYEFLIITDRGPTWHYQKYLNTINGSNDLLALISLSALINDALHHNG